MTRLFSYPQCELYKLKEENDCPEVCEGYDLECTRYIPTYNQQLPELPDKGKDARRYSSERDCSVVDYDSERPVVDAHSKRGEE